MTTLKSQIRRGSAHVSRTLESPQPDQIMTLRAARIVHSLHCSLQFAVTLHGLPLGREQAGDVAGMRLQCAENHLRQVLLEYPCLSASELRSATLAAYDHCVAVLALLEDAPPAAADEPGSVTTHAGC